MKTAIRPTDAMGAKTADPSEVARLQETARNLRRDILLMLHKAGSGHTGGSLSAADLITALFFSKMRHRPGEPRWPGRDRFVLSKGHAAPVYYAALAHSGYFPVSELMSLRQLGSCLQGHPDCLLTPGVEITSGSLGQGLSVALGMALALRLDANPARVYVLLGDGECQEGQVWEAAMAAAHFKCDNLCVLIDDNGLQIDGRVADIMNVEPLEDKWSAFGWRAIRIDGHDFSQILPALDEAALNTASPTAIIATTVKGKGVSFFEGKVKYHGVAPTDDELTRALAELERVS
jgi:transketolase